ncbi:MAG: heme exporter protein CcmD [Caulobacterales bacterium]|nr:heme exporter protein CcmD [Caulobacterales bacterium]
MADKYALFIWPAYLVTGVVFAALIGLSLSHSRRWKRRYEELSGKAPADPAKKAAP